MHSCTTIPQESCSNAKSVRQDFADLLRFLTYILSIYNLNPGVKRVLTANFSEAEKYLFL